MVYLAARVVPGIALGDGPLWPALLAGLVLALVNAVVRPVLLLLTLPLTVLTLGLFVFVLDAFCLWLTSVIVPRNAAREPWTTNPGTMTDVSHRQNAFSTNTKRPRVRSWA